MQHREARGIWKTNHQNSCFFPAAHYLERQVNMKPKCKIPWKFILPLILIFFSLPFANAALANYVSGSRTWGLATLYCSSGICGTVYGELYSIAGYEHRYITREERRVGNPTDFGGSVFPRSTFCGSSDWLRNATKYEDGDGVQTITGWIAEYTICPADKRCRAWQSDNLYTLSPSPFSGKFTSGFWFGNACFPNTISKTLTVSP